MLSVVVPCYNEEKNIPLLVERFDKAFRGFKGFYEIILVDNGSTDNSSAALNKVVNEYRKIKTVKIEKNIGYGHGILTGMKSAKGDILAYTHADLQCDPYDVLRAYKVFKKSSIKSLVKGNRYKRFSFLTICFHILATVLFLKKFDDINGQPKLFPRALIKTFTNPPVGFQFDFYVQYKAMENGYKVVSIPVIFASRRHGVSKWASSLDSKIKNIFGFLIYIIKLRFGK